jgi:hypothetical protein
MIDESTAVLPLWMLISAAFGFIIGETCGDHFRLRKHLQQANEDLRDQLQSAQPSTETLHSALNQQRSVINDIHKRVVAVSKGLQKPAS